jgi:hypothetical protein
VAKRLEKAEIPAGEFPVKFLILESKEKLPRSAAIIINTRSAMALRLAKIPVGMWKWDRAQEEEENIIKRLKSAMLYPDNDLPGMDFNTPPEVDSNTKLLMVLTASTHLPPTPAAGGAGVPGGGGGGYAGQCQTCYQYHTKDKECGEEL